MVIKHMRQYPLKRKTLFTLVLITKELKHIDVIWVGLQKYVLSQLTNQDFLDFWHEESLKLMLYQILEKKQDE